MLAKLTLPEIAEAFVSQGARVYVREKNAPNGTLRWPWMQVTRTSSFFWQFWSKKKDAPRQKCSEQQFMIALNPSRQDITHFLPVLSKNIQNLDWYLVLRPNSEMASFARPKSCFQRICFTVTYRQSHCKGSYTSHCKGSCTTTLPIPSPSRPCSRRRDRRNKALKACRTKHEKKESISK